MPSDSRSVCFIRDDYRWELRPSDVGLLTRLLDHPGEPVTHTATKLVTRSRLDGRTYYWKRYSHASRIWRPVKYWFKKPRSRHEWDRAERLGKAGVPVVPHLAHGERWTWRGLAESSLVTEAPAGARPLTPGDLESPAFQARFGSFIRRLHERGVTHLDPNAGNFLHSDELDSFFLVDLDKIEIRDGPLSTEDRLENLALFGAVLPALGDCFFSPSLGSEITLDMPRARATEKRRQLLAEEADRCLPPRQDDGFCSRSNPNADWLVRKAGLTASLEEILLDPDRSFEDRRAFYKDSRSSTVARVSGHVVKRYNLRRPWKWIKSNLRGSYARRAFRSAYQLELAGVPGPCAVAFGDRRRSGLLVASYLVTREIAGAVPLDQSDHHSPGVLCAVARLFACLHEAGFRQLDPKPSNILIDEKGGAHLVDMDGIRFMSRVAPQTALADLERFLARCAVTPGERELFVGMYRKQIAQSILKPGL